RMLLVDAGAETTMNYCSDFTRTFPVSGKFTPIQKDIFEIVQHAFEHGISMVKPDVMFRDVHLAAAKVIAQGLKDMGIMKGDVDDAVMNGAHAMFFPTGLGHHLGLDVHDMEGLGENFVGYGYEAERSSQFGLSKLRMAKNLKEGHVMTVEPGIYFIPILVAKWENEGVNKNFINFDKAREMLNFGGVRIEDDVLVTKNGHRVLGSKRIPYTVKTIEDFMQQ
ncbi:MAG: M24 family metallopeptidase, partial [Rikenellaceae bacterium]